jgi:transposase-like protein
MPQGDNFRKLTDEQRAEIVRLYLTPNSDGTWTGVCTIARQFNVTPTAILNTLRKRGVKIRTLREAYANGKRAKPITHLPQGKAPVCKCGCGNQVEWNRTKNRWNKYVEGHYRQNMPYKSRDWLNHQYTELKRTSEDISRQFGVNSSTILKFLRKFGIPIRRQAESLALSGAVKGDRNPAWKGGTAKWEYAHNWKRIARIIRKRDNYTCQICHTEFPRSSKLLHVHHKDGDKFNNNPNNLVTVCASCHPKGKRKENWKSPR